MISLIKYLRPAFVVMLLLFGFTLCVEAQQPQECEVSIKTDAPHYRIGQTMRLVSRTNTLAILISVDPKDFNSLIH
jgi:hypothetical protein